MINLWPEWGGWLAVLGALSGIMSGLTTIKTGIVALAFFSHRVGHDILDLCSGFVNILLQIGLVLHLSMLPGTSLLHWLPFLPWLELALVIISRRIVRYELLLPFSNESLVHQSLEI